uniref:Uncharacterized protein n=1 Tax=Nothoprocta perdicaria TaxID=30464 RepID=A0A8C6YNQ4_NOTPE
MAEGPRWGCRVGSWAHPTLGSLFPAMGHSEVPCWGCRIGSWEHHTLGRCRVGSWEHHTLGSLFPAVGHGEGPPAGVGPWWELHGHTLCRVNSRV